MKNQFMDIIKESCAFNPVNRRTMIDIHKTFFQYSSDILSALTMKDHGENLLIKPLWATSWPAGPGNTMLPAITRVFPTSFDATKKDLYANGFYLKKSVTHRFSSLCSFIPSPVT